MTIPRPRALVALLGCAAAVVLLLGARDRDPRRRRLRSPFNSAGAASDVLYFPPAGSDAAARGCESGGARPLHAWARDYAVGPKAHRQANYFDAFERELSKFCGRDEVRVLEVGVQSGGCIQMWRYFFGRDRLTYVGIDVNPLTAVWADARAHIYIGSVMNRALVRDVIERHGPFDVVIDDGAHSTDMMSALFDGVYSSRDGLRDDGVLCIEDLHTPCGATSGARARARRPSGTRSRARPRPPPSRSGTGRSGAAPATRRRGPARSRT